MLVLGIIVFVLASPFVVIGLAATFDGEPIGAAAALFGATLVLLGLELVSPGLLV